MFERRRASLRAEIARERREVQDLIDESEDWQTAKAIRAYVAAVRDAACGMADSQT
jgi:hypothetical protein